MASSSLFFDPFLYTVPENATDENHMRRLNDYLALREKNPQALATSRVLAFAAMSTEALISINSTLSSQDTPTKPIDMIFYSDVDTNQVTDSDALIIISFAKYTYPSKIAFIDGVIRKEGFLDLLYYIIDNPEYFINLETLEVSGNTISMSMMDDTSDLNKEIIDCIEIIRSSRDLYPKFSLLDLSNNEFSSLDTVFATSLSMLNRDGFTVLTEDTEGTLPSMCTKSNRYYFNYYNLDDPLDVKQCQLFYPREMTNSVFRPTSCEDLKGRRLNVLEDVKTFVINHDWDYPCKKVVEAAIEGFKDLREFIGVANSFHRYSSLCNVNSMYITSGSWYGNPCSNPTVSGQYLPYVGGPGYGYLFIAPSVKIEGDFTFPPLKIKEAYIAADDMIDCTKFVLESTIYNL